MIACNLNGYTNEVNMPNKENFYSSNYNYRRDRRKSIYISHSEEKTELHFAAIEGDLNRVQELLSGNIYENNYFLQDKDGNTPIHLAAEYGHKDCLKAILKKVLSDTDNKKMTLANSIDIKNSIGDTALHSVIRAIHKKNESNAKDYLECVKLLISCTNTNIKNDEKQTPLCLATSLKLVEVSRIFVKNGCVNCDIEDEYDFNAYDYIKNSEDLELIDLFHSYYQGREQDILNEIKNSKCIAMVSKNLSKYCNRLTAATGAASTITTAYQEFIEKSIDRHVKRSLIKISHSVEKLSSGVINCIENNKGKKEIARGKILAEKALTSATKVGKIVSHNKKSTIIKTVSLKTISSTLTFVTCALLLPVAIFYCASHYYHKREEILRNELKICKKRKNALNDIHSNLLNQRKKSKEQDKKIDNLENKLNAVIIESRNASLKESINDSRSEIFNIESNASCLKRTYSNKEQGKEKSTDSIKKLSAPLQFPSIIEVTYHDSPQRS